MLSAYIAIGGERAARTKACGMPTIGDLDARTNANGEASRPTTKARLKLSVARVESVAPSRSREKDCKACSCWAVALHRWVRPEASVMGKVSVLNVSKWSA